MPIKADRWIREMALKHGMIEPFVDEQVRGGVISYGLTSYGYDMRVTNQFKVFTNVFNALVDPKNFSPRSFVDIEAEHIDIPPNSFALAQSFELFRIPRTVSAIVIGKCVTGDTRVIDETGAYTAIANFRGSETATLRQWRIESGTVSAFAPQGTKPVYKLHTAAGLQIRATAEHPFRKLTGWTRLSELIPGDRIAVARSIPHWGDKPIQSWEVILLGLMIAEGQCHTLGNSPTFTSADPTLVQLIEECIREGFGGQAVFKGRFGYRLVNRSGRGGVPAPSKIYQWLKGYGLNVGASGKFVPQAIFQAPLEQITLFLRALFSGDGGFYRSGVGYLIEYTSISRRLIDDVRHLLLRFGIFTRIMCKHPKGGREAYTLYTANSQDILTFAQRIGFWPDSERQRRLEAALPALEALTPQRRKRDTLPREAWGIAQAALQSVGQPFAAANVRPRTSITLAYRDAAKIAALSNSLDLHSLINSDVYWDEVTSITYEGIEEVYDITVDGQHNFVANDIIVHNSTYARCGIIINVTPLEPEWEGYVTIEISNTTPLPARIYANEGIGQVLFLESDEPCEVSYADKKGKYQGQQGIVLPRIDREA